MSTFNERLTELMQEKEIKSQQLADIVGVSVITVNDWKRGRCQIFLSNAIKLADYFHCSLEFLMGRNDDYTHCIYLTCPPFYLQFMKVLEKKGISTYSIRKNGSIGGGHLSNWKKGRNPLVATLIPVVEYLDITLDYLVGREA